LFSLEVSGFSGFSIRLSAISGKADDAKVETAHHPLTPIMAPNLGILSRKRQLGSDIKPKDADTRAPRPARGFGAAEPTVADEKSTGHSGESSAARKPQVGCDSSRACDCASADALRCKLLRIGL
jgi:hypothetical protein